MYQRVASIKIYVKTTSTTNSKQPYLTLFAVKKTKQKLSLEAHRTTLKLLPSHSVNTDRLIP